MSGWHDGRCGKHAGVINVEIVIAIYYLVFFNLLEVVNKLGVPMVNTQMSA